MPDVPRLGRQRPPPLVLHRCGGTGIRFRPGARLVYRGAAEAYRYARKRMERES